MIAPKRGKPSAREEREAYELAELRDLATCRRCHRGYPVQRDHRKNRSQGGLTVVSNLQLLCLACHDWKSGNPDAACEQGWAVPSWAVPAEYPAARWLPTGNGTVHLAWVLYDDAGGIREISLQEADRRIDGDWPGVSRWEGSQQ